MFRRLRPLADDFHPALEPRLGVLCASRRLQTQPTAALRTDSFVLAASAELLKKDVRREAASKLDIGAEPETGVKRTGCPARNDRVFCEPLQEGPRYQL